MRNLIRCDACGQAAPGYSSGDAMAQMERIAATLPPGFGYELTGLSPASTNAGSHAALLYAFSILAVFLCLAALYESWSIPFAVLLVVPLGVLGVVLGTLGRGLSTDVYFQIGLVTIIGLSAKNAILSSSSPRTCRPKARVCLTPRWKPPTCGSARSS